MSWSYKAGERGVNRVRVAEDPEYEYWHSRYGVNK